jgi:hypothetical protein
MRPRAIRRYVDTTAPSASQSPSVTAFRTSTCGTADRVILKLWTPSSLEASHDVRHDGFRLLSSTDCQRQPTPDLVNS